MIMINASLMIKAIESNIKIKHAVKVSTWKAVKGVANSKQNDLGIWQIIQLKSNIHLGVG